MNTPPISPRLSPPVPCFSNDTSTISSPLSPHRPMDVQELDQENAPFLIDDAPSKPAPKTPLTFTNGLALVISLQIGSGIFYAPSQVANHTPSPGAAVLVWAIAGVLVWTGAASFIELGLAIPKNGGLQEYLRAVYGDFSGFMFSWIYVAICKPCANAIIAMIFAENVSMAVVSNGSLRVWEMKMIAIMGLLMITTMNCMGNVTGAKAANLFLFLKLSAVASIAVIGCFVGVKGMQRGTEQFQVEWFAKDPNIQRQNMHPWAKVGEYITAVYGALFCYGGWETVGFVAGDMVDPLRDLPRVINTAMTVAISGFVLVNVALYTVLPFQTIRERSVVAVDFGSEVFGPMGGLIYSLVVSISCLGALNANVFATGRLCVAASKQDFFPKVFGNGHCSSKEEDSISTKKMFHRLPKFTVRYILYLAEVTENLRWDKDVPVYAMMMTALTAAFYITVGTFDGLVTFIGITEYIFLFLAVLGIFMLRRRKQSLDRSQRTWTFNPIVFCVFSSFIIIRGIITAPFQGLALSILTLVGWAIFRRRLL